MKRIIQLLTAAIFFIGFYTEAKAQCEGITITGQGIDIKAPLVCADVTITLEASYTFAFPVADPSKVQIQVFWHDASSSTNIFTATETAPGSKTFKIAENKNYVAGTQCSYEPETYLIYDGKFCGSSRQAQRFASWSTDDTNPGPVLLEPVVAEFCASTPISNFTFYDNTTFNCNKNIEPDKPNRQTRWVQFIYNTSPTPAGLIRDVTVSGVPVTDGAGNFTQEIKGVITALPAPTDGSGLPTLDISAPANSPVGSYFEVTLRNWNICNPYDDPNIPGPPLDLVNGDNPPKTTTARIVIVASPQPVITTKNKDSNISATFCPNDKVRFEGAGGGGNLEYRWEIYNDETGINKIKSSGSKDFWFNEGFPNAGKKLIKLRVRRKNTFGSCWVEATKVVEVFDAPAIDSYINGNVVDELKLCHDPSLSSGQAVTYKFDLSGANTYNYQLSLYKRNSTSSSPDSLDGSGNIAGTGLIVGTSNASKSETYPAEYTRPGKYRVRMFVKDQSTGCSTEKELVTYVYDKPVAKFTFNQICQGQATSFSNDSFLKHKISGDDIDSYSWNFGDPDIAGGGTSNVKNPSHTYHSTGPFEVSLTVKTIAGCETIYKDNVTVYPIPAATLTSDYAGPLCPGESVEFTIGSFAANKALFDPGVVSYKLEYSDGTNTRVTDFVTGTDKRSVTFNNNMNSELTYTVKLKALSPDGCEKISDPVIIKVVPGAKAGFSDPDYSILNENCTDISFKFQPDDATMAIGGEEHTWIIKRNGTEILNETYFPADPEYTELPFTGTNTTNMWMKYEVILRVTKLNQCITPAVNTYLVNPRPAPGFTYTVREDCGTNQTHIDIKVNMLGIKDLDWDIFPAPSVAEAYDDEFTITYNKPLSAAGPYQVDLKLKKTNFFGCEENDYHTESVIVSPPLIESVELQLVSSAKEGCSPLVVDFKNTTVAPAGTTYEFYLKKGNEAEVLIPFADPAATGGAFSYTFNEPGNYKVRLKAISGSTCEKFSDYINDIKVFALPEPGFDLTKKEGCAPLTSGIIKNMVVGSSVNRWVVTDMDSNIDIIDTTDPAVTSFDFPNTGSAVKQYKVKLIATSSEGCSAESEVFVKVYPAPAASFTVTDLALCAPYEVEVTNTSVNPAGTTYSWNWGDGTSEAGSGPDEVLTHSFKNTSYSVAQLRYITLTATTPEGCTITSAPTEVTLRPQVQAAFSPGTTLGCSPLQLYLQNNSMGASTHNWVIKEKGSTGPAFYTSSVSLPADVPVLENSGSANKIYEVSLTVANADGCTSTHSEEITVMPGAKADFSMDYTAALCTESEVTFTNLNIMAGVSYIWNWGDGEENDTTTTEASLVHTFINTSTVRAKLYEVTLTALTPGSACSDVMKKTIRVNPTVEAIVVPDKLKGCAPLEVNFINQSRNVATHSWYVSLAGSDAQDQQQGAEEGSFVMENNTGSILQYIITYVGTSSTGCPDTARTTVSVYPKPEPAFTTDSIRVRLPNSTFKIFNETPHPDAWTYHWDFGDNTTSTEADPGQHTYKTYGTYKITLRISNDLCTETYSQEVIVNGILPVVDFESIPVSGCWPLVVQFENRSNYADPNTYRWDFGDDEGYASSENPVYTYHKPGTYTVTLSASNPTGEAVSQSYAIVNVYERPRIAFEVRENVVFVPGNPLYVANYTRGATSYLWDFGDGTTYTDFEPVHYYQEPGVYTISLIATNEWGCADTLVRNEIVTAEAGGKVKIPNAFTPNVSGSTGGSVDAGNNDVFFPVLDGGISKYNMRVYNRWGELLFESNQRDMGWDGYYKGRLCKADVYVYKLRVEFSDGNKLEKLGDVTLIR